MMINKLAAKCQREYEFYHLSEADQSLALSLLEQAKGLRKVCPAQEWECLDRCKINGESRNADGDFADHMKACHGTGSLPVTADDVEVMVR